MRPASVLLLSVLTVIAFLSCGGSSDDTPDTPVPQPKENPIVFSGSLSEGKSESQTQSRAGETSVPLYEYPTAEAGHTSFHAWSYKTKTSDPLAIDEVMKDYTVNWTSGSAGTTISNTNDWEYVGQGSTPQTIKYWDYSAVDYRFFGYSGTAPAPSYTFEAGVLKSVSLTFSVNAETEATPTATSPLYSTLWKKTGTALSASNQPVVLTFIRPIARVRFIFTYVEGVTFDRKDLHDISFKPTNTQKGTAKNGTVTISYPLTGEKETWTSTVSDPFITFNIDYFETPEPGVLSTDPNYISDKAHHWYYVLPRLGPGDGEESQGSYTLSVMVGNTEEPTVCQVPAEYMTWAPGYDYTYIFKLTASGSVSLSNVQVAINEWHVKDAVEHPVYNW